MHQQPYPLTVPIQAGYLDLILTLWPQLSGKFSTSAVTDNVTHIMDHTLNSLVDCSRAMPIIAESYRDFYQRPATGNKWRQLIEQDISRFHTWLTTLQHNIIYQSCLDKAISHWREAITTALNTAS